MIKKYVKVVIFIKMYVCMQLLVPPKPSVCCGPPPSPQDGARFPFISLDCMTSLVKDVTLERQWYFVSTVSASQICSLCAVSPHMMALTNSWL